MGSRWPACCADIVAWRRANAFRCALQAVSKPLRTVPAPAVGPSGDPATNCEIDPPARICAYAHMDIPTAPPVTAVLSALADPTRLGAMRLLWDGGEHCACELIDRLGATQSRVSRHMQALARAGLVCARRDGPWVRYRIAPGLDAQIAAVLDAVMVAAGPVPAPPRATECAA